MLYPRASRMLALLSLLCCNARAQNASATPDPRSTLSGDRPLSVFRRAQDETSCPDADVVIDGSTVVANSGALYHVAHSQTHGVRLTVGENSRLTGFRFWCFAPACTRDNPPCTSEQVLGQTAIALYNGLPAPQEGISTQIPRTLSVPITGCNAGWNTVELEGEPEPLEPGQYWIVMSHERDWQTSYAPGTQLLRSGVGLANDLSASGFVSYDAHAPSSSVPLGATMCDESNSRACLDQCIGADGDPQPDWSNPSASCFWLLRHIDQDFECISTCGEELILDVRRDVARCQEGYDGFSADLSDNIHVVQRTNDAFIDIPGAVGDYETAGLGGRHALFSYGSGFDARNGVYTANTAGLYLVTANVRLGGANQGDIVAAAIEINGQSEAGNGLTVRQHNIRSATGTEGLWTLTMCGVVQLAVADTMNLAISMPADDDFYVHSETGFHAVLLQTHSGFAAALSEPVVVAGTASDSWMHLTSFDTAGTGMFDQLYQGVSVFDAAAGTFTAPEDGIYFTSASIRLADVVRISNAASFNTRITIALNSAASGPDVTEGTGLTTIGADEPNSQGDRHEVVTGVLRLSQGDTLSVWLQVADADSFSIEAESSFAAVAMESQEGFEVQLVRDTAVTGRDSFVEVAGFRTVDTHAESPSLFATTLSSVGFSVGLDTLTGRYTAGFPGVYFAQTTVRLAEANEGNFIRVVIALNSEVEDSVNGGISAISGEIDDRTKDIDVSGLLSLNVGDFFSVWVNVGGDRSQPDDDYVILRQTRFAGVFITSPPRTMTQCPDGERPNPDYNGDTCSDCLASGASCARCANVFGFDCSCACVADECTEVPNDEFGGDTCSECLHSGASCEDCMSDRFNFNCDCACNENNEWAFWRPDRCFEVDCGERGFCYEGSCLCVDGYRGTNCIVPPGQGMRCSDRLAISRTCDNSAGEQVVSLGSVTSQASCRSLCQTQAESGTNVEAGCCQWNGEQDGTMASCEYIRGATTTVEASGMSAAICELTTIHDADDDYSLIVDDCTDIQPVTARLVEAVIKLHSQLQNRACVDGYFENEFGICEPTVPIDEPVVSVTANSCSGRNPSRRGQPIECAFIGEITTVPGPTGEDSGPLAGMRFASDDAMILLHPFETSAAGGFPLTSRDNPEGEWTLDTWFKTPLEPGQWRTLVRGATGDSQVLVAPAQESQWSTATYTASVGSLTTDDPGYFYGSTEPPEVTNWNGLGSFETPGTTIPDENARPLSQEYYTNLVQGSRLSLGTYSGSGGDAGAGLPDKFTDTGFDIGTLDAGWHRLVVVCNGTATLFYIDGENVGIGAASKTDIYAIGNQPLGGHPFGAIAGLRLYDHALSRVDALSMSGGAPDAGGR